MLMGGAGQEIPVQTISIPEPPDCPYGAEGCPKVEELREEIKAIRKENNVIWKELNKVDKTTSSILSSLSGLKWLVFVLVCGATGIGVYL